MDASIKEDTMLPFLEAIPLFDNLRLEQRRYLASGSSILDCKRGALVCKQGEIPGGFYCVLHGRVKLAMLASSGDERVIEIMQPGDSFGESSLFLQQPWPVYAQALVSSRLLFIGRQVVLSGILHWPEFSLTMLTGMSARVHGLLSELEACCLKTASQRVAQYLLDQGQPCDCKPGAGTVTLLAGKAVIASALSLTPETFSRELRRLVNQNLISVQRNSIYVHDRARLRKILA
jgi:CRP-like cAMP-binding protein